VSDLVAAFLLGILEGLTEFLPISSTGHLLIAQQWLGRRSDQFNVVIQLGAIFAVVAVFRHRLLALVGGLAQPEHRDYAFKLGAAFLVTCVFGGAAKLSGVGLPADIRPIAWAMILGAIAMLMIDQRAWHRALREAPREDISWRAVAWVGIAQALAGIFPGTSRSAAAIFAALLAGVTCRGAATEFAFLVGIPTMVAAAGYELAAHSRSEIPEDWAALGVGFTAAALSAFIVVRWLIRFLQTHRFTVFAVYRLLVGAALLWLLPGH
jgi:undecaprenyl-diphosphatase